MTKDSGTALPVTSVEADSPNHDMTPEMLRWMGRVPVKGSNKDPEPPTYGAPVKGQPLVYSMQAVEAAARALAHQTTDRDRREQVNVLLGHMLRQGPSRALAQPKRRWSQELDRLKERFPNFEEVVEFIRCEFTLRQAAKKPLALPPIAIYGAPGMGKSVFMEALAELLCCEYHRIQAETAQHGAVLVGTDKHYSNAQAGLVLERLVWGPYANPLFYVDEIDKVNDERGTKSITSTLYALLESASASKFKDAAFPDVTLDASHVQWVFAANDIRHVPPAIRSRWTEFRIHPMKPEQARGVVQNIYATLLQTFRVKGMEPLSQADLDVLSKKSPREMQSLLRQCIAKAVMTKSKQPKLEPIVGHGLGGSEKEEPLPAPLPERSPEHLRERWVVVTDSQFQELVGPERVLH